MNVEKRLFGYVDNKEVINYIFTHKTGFKVEISSLGASIIDIKSKDRKNNYESVVLGFDNAEDYIKNSGSYFGCIVGRVAGRIENGEFSLENKKYELAKNDGVNSLHGGRVGFNQKLFTIKEVRSEDDEALITLTYLSVDGEENYPGNLTLEVTYTIKDHLLDMDIVAYSDKTTIIDITNHVGFNLSGDVKESIRDHILFIDADKFALLNERFIPYTLKRVDNGPFDFRKPKFIKDALDSNDEQIIFAGGVDHPFLLNHHHDPDIYLFHSESGRLLEIKTNQNAAVAYSGNFLTKDVTMRNEKKGFKNAMICLETQSLPNAINNHEFPSIILKKDEKYHHNTKYHFSVK